MLKKMVIIPSLLILLSGCNTPGNTRLTSPITPLTYQAGSSVFILKKDCVTGVSSRNHGHNVFLISKTALIAQCSLKIFSAVMWVNMLMFISIMSLLWIKQK